jgi:nitrite reductase/ring-hydroxylating ferredoxin subunit
MAERAEEPLRVPLPEALRSEGLAIVQAADRQIVVLEVDGALRAIDRWCPHEDGDLGEGMMFRGDIKCPVHGYIFSLARGRCLNAFGLSARVYQVEESDGYLELIAISQASNREG